LDCFHGYTHAQSRVCWGASLCSIAAFYVAAVL
jgi:hypothetical protein